MPTDQIKTLAIEAAELAFREKRSGNKHTIIESLAAAIEAYEKVMRRVFIDIPNTPDGHIGYTCVRHSTHTLPQPPSEVK